MEIIQKYGIENIRKREGKPLEIWVEKVKSPHKGCWIWYKDYLRPVNLDALISYMYKKELKRKVTIDEFNNYKAKAKLIANFEYKHPNKKYRYCRISIFFDNKINQIYISNTFFGIDHYSCGDWRCDDFWCSCGPPFEVHIKGKYYIINETARYMNDYFFGMLQLVKTRYDECECEECDEIYDRGNKFNGEENNKSVLISKLLSFQNMIRNRIKTETLQTKCWRLIILLRINYNAIPKTIIL